MYTQGSPTDLRWTDGREVPSVPRKADIDIVLSLVERVCGPGSEVAKMLTPEWMGR